MKKIKVLVADDSAFMRKMISDMLNSAEGIEVVGSARNGEEAFKKTMDLKPDIITMDVEMPVLTGIEAVQKITAFKEIPIIMLSSTTRAGADNTMLAMEAGAYDFIAKPSGAVSLDIEKVKLELIQKVSSAVKHKKIENAEESAFIHPSAAEKNFTLHKTGSQKVILIGVSTGGPKALHHIFSKLPGNLCAPVVIVQHMPKGFTASLADRLDAVSKLTVKEAVNGEKVTAGTVYLAPGGYHVELQEGTNGIVIHLSTKDPVRGHRPSVDILFHSACSVSCYPMAVVLTGMGSDGASGITALKKSGPSFIIAESEESSVVYGMPKAALATGTVDEIVHIKDVAETIANFVRQGETIWK
ncbi:protein-glutamate methylesterase/protein-glutamine glutaminase [Fictibacillus terranigra]|uniref:Protein-glutamate methylesterase/protein-glutamine glutaminase n=1 Tax=Fictibacillus terranigra TaxID=3058424 RepID=A0ABT8E6B3_9BACL|nr:chemotaxis response regulator protein-glutamate methylesterase [Fictibacillus sp. CENA-BCM004]MDN4073419.1 chemotaxis response regulator protein-glutamate methylesterase [Fictibacillus sp. CENA-BCM004]